MAERDFKGIWIPKEIWLSDDLNWSEKILLTEIDSLSSNKECFASNEYLATFLGLSKDRISKLISSLSKKGYIEVVLKYKNDSKQVEKRIINVTLKCLSQLYPIGENNYTPIGENNEDNNTVFINTKNKYRCSYDKQINEYTHNEDLKAALIDFIEMRKKIKSPIATDRAINMLFNNLDKLSCNDINKKIAILEQSIFNNWKGVFDIKNKDNNQPSQFNERTDIKPETLEKIRRYREQNGN